jgi:hypothetical protein
MREQLCLALAKHAGKELTREVALQIVADLCPDRTLNPTQFGRQQCGSLTFQAELLRDIQGEMHALHQLHWLETEGHRHGLALDMDYEALLAEERAGACVQFTARQAGLLVGNFRLYLRVSRHTRTPFAKEDTWYLMPEARGGRNALRFLDFAGQALRSIGYREFRADNKHSSPAAGRLLLHRGFKPVATEYVLIDQEQHHESAA